MHRSLVAPSYWIPLLNGFEEFLTSGLRVASSTWSSVTVIVFGRASSFERDRYVVTGAFEQPTSIG